MSVMQLLLFKFDSLLLLSVLEIAGKFDIISLPIVRGTKLYILSIIETAKRLTLSKTSTKLKAKNMVLFID